MTPYIKQPQVERKLHSTAPMQILGKRGLFRNSTVKSGLKIDLDTKMSKYIMQDQTAQVTCSIKHKDFILMIFHL